MLKAQYEEKRKALLEEAQNLVNEGKLDEFEAKKKEIEQLDELFDKAAKAQANLDALSGARKGGGISAANVTLNAYNTIEKTGGKPGPIDVTDSEEYRRAFMNYVVRGTPIPGALLNADENTKTTDVPAVIPTTIIRRIIQKMESQSMILSRITKTNYQGGVSIPVSTVKPEATWVSEGAGSDKQKKVVGSITFAYYKLRCAVSVSLEVSVTTLDLFEARFTEDVAEAMIGKLESTILVDGLGRDGGQPEAILKTTPPAGQVVEIAADGDVEYSTLVEAEAKLPMAYERGAVWLMTKKTYFEKVVGMTDEVGQPIARTNIGISGRPEYTILGRPVILNDYMASYAGTVAQDTIFAAIFNLEDYVLNYNLNMTVKRYEDNDTDDQITKAVLLADGKVVDNNSLVILTKKAA